MLLGEELLQLQRFPLGKRWQHPFLLLRVVVHPFDIQLHEPGKADDCAGRPEPVSVADADIDRCLVKERLGHLAGDRPFPDQVVQLELVRREELFEFRRCLVDVGGTDRLVRLLGVLRLVLEEAGLCQSVLLAVERR